MKLTCTQENLNQGLNVTGHLVNKNINLPILNNILIEAKNDQIKLASTNLEIGISCTIRGKVETEGSFTAEAKLLSDYIALLPKDNVDVALLKDDFLNIKCKNNNTRIKGISSEDFPVIPEVEKTNAYTIKTEDFKTAISQVIFAVSNNDTRPEIGGVLMVFHAEEGILTLVGTDSYRLAEKKIKLEGHTAKNDIIVPVKTLQEVQRILSSFKEIDESRENISIYLSENQILFAINGIEVISRLVEGRFPDYKQIIPQSTKTKTVINNQELTKIIKTTALFSKTGIFDINFEFLPENKSLVITSNNIQVGDSCSELEVEFEGEKNATTLNYRFLLECLSNINSGEIEFSLVDSNIPCIMRPKGDNTYTYIIMPIKQ